MSSVDTNKPHLIITVGIPGSGKSFIASHFANTFHAPIISDERVRQLAFGTPTYTKDEDAIINQLLRHLLTEVMKTERTIVFDGNTISRAERSQIAKLAKEAGYDPLFVWVQTDLSTSKQRAMSPSRGDMALNDETFDGRVKQFSPPHATEKPIVISGKHTYATQLKIILRHLAQPADEAKVKTNPVTRPPLKRTFLIR